MPLSVYKKKVFEYTVCVCVVLNGCDATVQGGTVEAPGPAQEGLPQVLSQHEECSQGPIHSGVHW